MKVSIPTYFVLASILASAMGSPLLADLSENLRPGHHNPHKGHHHHSSLVSSAVEFSTPASTESVTPSSTFSTIETSSTVETSSPSVTSSPDASSSAESSTYWPDYYSTVDMDPMHNPRPRDVMKSLRYTDFPFAEPSGGFAGIFHSIESRILSDFSSIEAHHQHQHHHHHSTSSVVSEVTGSPSASTVDFSSSIDASATPSV